MQTGTGGSPASSEKLDVLFVADGSGLGFVRSRMVGMVRARAKDIGDRKGQLITKMNQDMS